MWYLRGICLLLLATVSGCTPDAPRTVDLGGDLSPQLVELERSIGDSRVVLLGENGHGVGSLTDAKAMLVEWLRTEMDFTVVAFESGYFECGRLNGDGEGDAAQRLFDCLRYPFQHRELLPVFQSVGASGPGADTLVLAGVDLQAQGFDSEPRPAWSRSVLEGRDPGLAAEVARLDTLLYLVEDAGGLGDSVYAWTAEHGDSAIAAYRRAADLVSGWERGVFLLAEGWIERLRVRGRAEAQDPDGAVPARYYELRDEWMARAVRFLADSVHPDRKLVVWLHNDHARYWKLESPGGPIRSTGGYLREWMGDEIYSIGFFMGEGVVVDNGRRPRETSSPEPDGIEAWMHRGDSLASYVVLRGREDGPVAEWATSERAYMRMGFQPETLIPAREFDALFYVGTARPPDFEVRR